jgi:hypothetical protein
VDQLIPSLAALVEGFRPCFRHEVFQTFQHILVGWIICPGPRRPVVHGCEDRAGESGAGPGRGGSVA